MEAAWNSINYLFAQKHASSDSSAKNADTVGEKHATKRETEFVSMLASSIGKVSIFGLWQQEQLECLAPMASLHSANSTCDVTMHVEDSNASNIVLKKLRSKQFDIHRAIYSDYVRQLGLSKRSVLLVLDGVLNIHQKNRVKHLQRGETMVLNHVGGTKSSVHCSSESLEPSSFTFNEISCSSDSSFFYCIVSQAAIKSVARTTMFNSKVEFSLARDSLIRSQAITLDAIEQAPNCNIRVFFPSEVFTVHPSETDDPISIIVCGFSSCAKSENVAARFQATCIVRQIAESQSLSLQQTVFFAASRKTQRNPGQQEQKKSWRINDPFIMTRSQPEISAAEHESSKTNYSAAAERNIENPFMKKLPPIPLLFEGFEACFPRSPSLHKRKGHLSNANIEMPLPGLDKSTLPSCSLRPRKFELEHADLEDVPLMTEPFSHTFVERECPVVTKNTAFWGYTPQLHEPCSNAKFYWALVRLFVHSCQKRVHDLKSTGQPLDISPLYHVGNEGQQRFKFLTVSVLYTLPCNEAKVVLNPLQHVITNFVTWQNDLCVQAHFRSANNVSNLLARTSNLKCFSSIPEQTRKLILSSCSFEEWPPGALILCMIHCNQFCI